MRIREADPDRDLTTIRALWREFLTWADGELARRHGIRVAVEEVLASDLADLTPFAPPAGRLLLVDDVGIGGLRRLTDDAGEIKRMYVRPAARGTGVGAGVMTAGPAPGGQDPPCRARRQMKIVWAPSAISMKSEALMMPSTPS